MATTKQALVQTLIDCGADRGFTLPGMGITMMLDAFYEQRDKFKVVLTRSEQVASVMAQVTGRLTGKPGVFMGMGPFAGTTGAFGILEAYFAGSPMVILTDTSEYNGFGQYGVYQTMTGDYGAADIRNILKSMTKYCTYADQPEDAVYGLQLAFKHASLPRQGPAAVILKTPILKRDMPEHPRAALYPSSGYLAYTPPRPDDYAVKQLAQMLSEAKYPLIIAGNGASSETARDLLAELADRCGIAVATSYNGKGVVDETAPYAVGMLGNWGNKNANRTLQAADLVVMLGASMAPDYTRFRDAAMIRPGEQKIVQIDIDPRNAGWVYPVDLAITGDSADVLRMLKQETLGAEHKATRCKHIAALKLENAYNELPITPSVAGVLQFSDISSTLSKFLTANDMLVLDAGTNRIWLTATLAIRHPGQMLVPGGIGGMGWGTPAAAAAKMVYPQKRITCVIGDGGFAMTMNAMITCVQENLPITVIVANNNGLGMVRDNMQDKKIAVDFTQVDFAQVARGMGCHGIRVDHPDQLGDALAQAHQHSGPVVIDALVDPAGSHMMVSDY